MRNKYTFIVTEELIGEKSAQVTYQQITENESGPMTLTRTLVLLSYREFIARVCSLTGARPIETPQNKDTLQ
jgi:hypothetical protein